VSPVLLVKPVFRNPTGKNSTMLICFMYDGDKFVSDISTYSNEEF